MREFSTITYARERIQELLGDSTPEELDKFIQVLKEKGHLTTVSTTDHTFELADMSQKEFDECVLLVYGLDFMLKA